MGPARPKNFGPYPGPGEEPRPQVPSRLGSNAFDVRVRSSIYSKFRSSIYSKFDRTTKLRSVNGVRANCAAEVAELIISRIRIVNPDFILFHGYSLKRRKMQTLRGKVALRPVEFLNETGSNR